ncbi:MAG: hypothetical protein A2792_12825 [Sphingomonadales bacterium RIFCSPHIGHO2_01_FULL_65_20]|jgi:TonB family protein|uniref:energy transducer TonB n=1 Tax=unclassified Blastomonas TaxID=2626550 RepID=UPI000830FC5F|nr:energy transducer TonB [Blastomonas sp.]MCH2236383.1 energy transducer TonB [Blastomonas sp.]OHC94638.1 MAG: hypothetical protein A2792_12825 [Sphingomonadales bacterium RIFCSPHIGHO2_01_FULL_65_20]
MQLTGRVSGVLALGVFCVLALPANALAVETKEVDESQLRFPIYPARGPQPEKRAAKVGFASNGFDLPEGNCKVIESSGDSEADKQACRSVNFFATPPGKMAIVSTPVWTFPKISGEFVRPKLLNGHKFGTSIYPDAALRGGQQGTVVFRVLVGLDGKVGGCEIVGSSSYRMLDNATCKTAAKFRFSPGTLDGQAVESFYMSTIMFYKGAGPRSKPRELP